MHILADHYRSEFLATPQLIRFEYAKGQDGSEPTLLIKASTLVLKYIVQGVQLRLSFSLLGDRLLYALHVSDDESKPAMLWSILEHDKEKAALRALGRGEPCRIFLFNELAVNVAWAALPIDVGEDLGQLAAQATTGEADHAALKKDVSIVLDRVHEQDDSGSGSILVDVPTGLQWNPIISRYFTRQAAASPIELFGKDEGGQQELLAVWLTDSLHPSGAYHSPQIPKGRGSRELTDVLLTYEFGSILVESKALTIFGRQTLPSRSKLARDIASHIKKAINQLRGAIGKLKDGTQVTSRTGAQLEVERKLPSHGIVLIPELDLVENRADYGIELILEFMRKTGGFLHLLDVAELLRIVQAAEMISARSMQITPMMAFDYYLMERAEKARESGTLCIEILLRFADE